jgi:outer membrane protein insertion porin family
MRKLFIFLCLSFALLAGAQERLHLVKIVVTGSQRYQPQDLVRATGLKENFLVTREELDASTKRLIDSGVFAAVEYTFRPAANVRGVEAVFQVKDAEKFLPAEFENFVWWSDSELENSLHQAVPLFAGKAVPLAGTLPDEIATALSKLLESKNVNTKVVWQQWAAVGQLPSAYRFKVASGVPKIKDVQLQGASHVPPDVLTRFVDSLKGRDYLRSELNKNLERILVPAYLEHGYALFKVTDVQPLVADDKTLSINISVSEGNRYKLGGYSWSGNTAATAEQLSRFVTLKPNEPVNVVALEKNVEAARKFLGKFGRVAATIKPVPAFSGDNVTYDFQVTEGDLYRMGDLEIEGLDSAATQKMRDLWKLAPGSTYDSTYVAYFVSHLILRRAGSVFTCEYLEQPDDAQKVVNIRLQFKAD